MKLFELKWDGREYVVVCGWYDSQIGLLDSETLETVIKVQLDSSNLNRDMCLVEAHTCTYAVAISKGLVKIKFDIENC